MVSIMKTKQQWIDIQQKIVDEMKREGSAPPVNMPRIDYLKVDQDPNREHFKLTWKTSEEYVLFMLRWS